MPDSFDAPGESGAAPGGLSPLRAARSRARAIRGGIVKIAFGTVFLIGALAHALSPERHERSSLLWMTTLLLLSTVNVAWGLRAIALARARHGSPWIFASVAWAVLAVVLLGLLLRR
jgi:hypothetical protein